MSDSFVPLLPVNQKSTDASFAPLAGNGAVLKASAIAQAAAANGATAEPCGKPIVTLQKNGDVVSSIRVECTCGQVIDLSCVY